MLITPSSPPPATSPHEGSRGRRDRHRRLHRPAHLENAKWIWVREADSPDNTFIYARKQLTLRAKPASATISVAADSRYKLYINGKYVGKGSVPPGIGYTFFDTHDVTGLLDKGDNVIALLAHYSGECAGRPSHPGVLCQASIELPNENITITTDETWRVLSAPDWSSGARIGEGLGFQEVYDARAAQDGWNNVKFRDRDWEDATVVAPSGALPWGKMVPRDIPPLFEERLLPHAVVGAYNSPARGADLQMADLPQAMAEAELSPLSRGAVKEPNALTAEHGITHIKTPRGDEGVVVILDFGREVFGNLEIGIAGSASGSIDIGYSELLEDGRAKPNRLDMRYADAIRLRKGRLEWQSFDPRGFRYVQIEFRRCTKAVALEYVRINETTYPVRETGSFECSDSLLNEVWRIGARTVRLCMSDTFITSPWSELGQWWGDARIESRAAFYAFGDSALLAQALRQIVDSQRPDGAIPGMHPAIDEDTIPDYALLWVFSILDHYGFANDADLLAGLYPSVRRLLGWFARHAGEDGLLAQVPGRLFIDHADLARSGTVTSLNCLYYQGIRVAGVIASVIGNQADANEYAAAAAKLRLAINKHLYSPKRGLYADCRIDGKLVEEYSRQTNVLAALFDIPDHYQKSTICRQLLDGSLPAISTPYFASYLLETLYSADLHVEALDVIREKWGKMVDAGATTLWEFFSQQGGLCHGWSACPTRDLIAEYVGIKPVLGSQRFSVAPHTGGLKWAKGSLNTHAGLLTVEWKAGRDHLLMKIDVPQGLKVDVYPPGPPASRVSLDGNPQAGRFLALGGGSHQVKVTAPRPERAPKLDETFTPSLPEQVEVLGEVYSRWPRRERGGRRRTQVGLSGMREARGERPRSTHDEPAVEAVEELTEVSGSDLVETAIEAQTGEMAVVREDEAVDADSTEASRKSRRRRPRRGRRKPETTQVTSDEQAPEAVEAGPAPEPVSEPEETPTIEPAEEGESEARTSRKRRPRRGGRRHRTSAASKAAEGEAEAQQDGEAAVTTERVASTEPEAAERMPVQPEVGNAADDAEQTRAPRRRRRYRSSAPRRRSSGSGEPGEPGEPPPG